jgi:hypothetical protein
LMSSPAPVGMFLIFKAVSGLSGCLSIKLTTTRRRQLCRGAIRSQKAKVRPIC